jgi:hypothetical protein
MYSGCFPSEEPQKTQILAGNLAVMVNVAMGMGGVRKRTGVGDDAAQTFIIF